MFCKRITRKIAKVLIACIILTSCLATPLSALAATAVDATRGTVPLPGGSVPRSLYFLGENNFRVSPDGAYFLMASAEDFTTYLLTSADAQEWTVVGETNNLAIGNDIIFADAVGDSYRMLIFSEDGVTWASIPATSRDFHRVRFEHGKFISQNFVSADGRDWYDLTGDLPVEAIDPNISVLPDERYVVVGGFDRNVAYTAGSVSGTATEWQPVTLPDETFWAIQVDGGGMVGFSVRDNLYHRSVDGVAWERFEDAPWWAVPRPPFPLGSFAERADLSYESESIGPFTHTVSVESLDATFIWVDGNRIATPEELPPGRRNTPYSFTPEYSGEAGAMITLVEGSTLPAGLSFCEDTLELRGTPQETGTFDFTVLVGQSPGGFYITYVLRIDAAQESGRPPGSTGSAPGAAAPEEPPDETPGETPDEGPGEGPDEIPDPRPDIPSIFNDVRDQDWFSAYAMWAYGNGYMIGVGGGDFAPGAEISDAMVVTVLARLAGVDLSAYAPGEFADIAPGQWFSETAAWAKAIGLLGDKDFDPGLPTSRADLALMLVRFLNYLGLEYTAPETPAEFADADEMTPEENEAFQILYQLGIFRGMGDGRMDPQGSTTRAQLAALLYRVSVLVEAPVVDDGADAEDAEAEA